MADAGNENRSGRRCSRRRRIVIALLGVCVSPLLAVGLLYHVAYSQTMAACRKLHVDPGVCELELLDVAPSKTHGVRFLWRIKFARQSEFMPADLVYWRLRPPGEIEFAK